MSASPDTQKEASAVTQKPNDTSVVKKSASGPPYPTKNDNSHLENSQDSSYPQKGKGKGKKDYKRKETKIQCLRRWIAEFTFIYNVLSGAMVVSMCVLGLLLLYNHIGTKKNLGGRWNRLYPSSQAYEEISISSTSEHCNEFGRQWATEGHDTEELALLMTLCLDYFSPHESGSNGASTLLYSKVNQKTGKPDCWQSTGREDTVRNLTRFYKTTRSAPISGFVGPYSMALPGHYRTLIALSQIMGATRWREKFSRVTEKLYHQLANTAYMVPKSLVSAFHHPDLEMQIFARSRLRKMADAVRREGDTWPISVTKPRSILTALDDFLGVINGTRPKSSLLISKESQISKALTDSLVEMKTSDLIDYQNSRIEHIVSTEVGHLLEVVPWTVRVSGVDYSVCAPNLVDFGTKTKMSSLTVAGLKLLAKKGKKLKGRLNEDKDYFLLMNKAIEKVYNKTAGYGLRKLKKMGQETRTVYEKLKNRAWEEWTVPAASSGFVIVNHKGKEAFVYGGTPGTALGSLMTLEEKEFINNLMAYKGKDFDKLGDVYFYQEPVIITRKEGKKADIHLAYLDVPDSAFPGTNILRKISSLYLNLFHDLSLKEVLSFPIFYIDIFKRHFCRSDDIPFNRFQEIKTGQRELEKKKEAKNGDDKEEDIERLDSKSTKVLKEKDSVIAVDGKEAISWTADDDKKTWRSPSGI